MIKVKYGWKRFSVDVMSNNCGKFIREIDVLGSVIYRDLLSLMVISRIKKFNFKRLI